MEATKQANANDKSSELTFDDAVVKLGALAQETRLRLFRSLVKRGPEGAAAGELATELVVAANTLSFHLKDLTQAGLISSTRDGRFIRYTLEVGAMRDLLTFLTQDCCQGREDLCFTIDSKDCC